MFDINMYDLQNKVTYCNWRTGMVFNDTENYKLSILFPLARWATIEMPSNG